MVQPMNSQIQANILSGAEAMVRMLEAHGVKHIFGLCGDTTLPLYDAMYRLDHGITHLLTRDERHAAYMADAYARVTGRPGVCEGPSGGGATYILPGVVEANESSIPVLAINSDVSTGSRGRYPLTELDQVALFRPVTKWNASLDDAQRLPAMVRRAFREMTTGRPGAVHLALPFDTQKNPVTPDEIWADARHQAFPALPTAPNGGAVKAAAEALLSARRAVAICGGGVVIADAMDALLELSVLLDLPIATTVSGQGAIAETDPRAVGVVGSNGGVASTRVVVENADLVLFIGCRAGSVTTERWRHPMAGARVVHIDSDPAVLGANYPAEVAVAGDARLALEMIVAELAGRGSKGGHDGAARAKAAWAAKHAAFEPLAASSERLIRPERVVDTLHKLLGDDAIICADPGTPCPYFSAHYRWPRSGRHFITNRAHGALGFAMGASIGAHAGRPGVKTVSVMGDGSFGMSVGELETVIRYNMPITFITLSNSAFGWIKAGQRSGFGARFHNVDFTRTDHAAVAAAYGLKSWRVEDPGELETVLKRALEAGEPTLVDIVTQPLDEAAAPVSEWVA
jgi:acetolactate synthase-1/2/3 large subunit